MENLEYTYSQEKITLKSVFKIAERPGISFESKFVGKMDALETFLTNIGLAYHEDIVAHTFDIHLHTTGKTIDPRLSVIMSTLAQSCGCVLVWTEIPWVSDMEKISRTFIIYGEKNKVDIVNHILLSLVLGLYKLKDRKAKEKSRWNMYRRRKGLVSTIDSREYAQNVYESQIEYIESHIPQGLFDLANAPKTISRRLQAKLIEYGKLDYNAFHRWFNPKIKHAKARKYKFQKNKII